MNPTILFLAALLAAPPVDEAVVDSIQGPAITAETAQGKARRFAWPSWPFDFLSQADATAPHSVVISLEPAGNEKDSPEGDQPQLLVGAKSGTRLPIRVWTVDYGPAGATRTQPPDPDDNRNWLGNGNEDPYWLVVLPRSWIANPKVSGGSYLGRKLSLNDGQWTTFSVSPYLAVDLTEAPEPDDFHATLVLDVRDSKGVAVPFRFRGRGEHQRDPAGWSQSTKALKCAVTLRVARAAQTPPGTAPATAPPQAPAPSQPKDGADSPEITITAPGDDSVTSARLITVSGTSKGLPTGTRLQVWVATDMPYLQDVSGIVRDDGRWSSPGVVLGGFPAPYVHRIYITGSLDGKTVRSDTIKVTKR